MSKEKLRAVELSGRKVLVTGGAGFIGSHLVDELVKLGCHITVLDDFSNGLEENLADACASGDVRIVRGTVEDYSLVQSLVGESEVIFHQAALNLLRSVESPVHDLLVNATGTLNMLTSMKEADKECVMVFASTGSVYGEPQYSPQDEDHPLRPVSPYGVSKLVAEQYVLLWHHLFGVKTVALRYYNVYGPRQNYGPKGGVVSIFIDHVMHGQPPIIEGTGNQERCFTFVEDVVRANLLAATTEAAWGRVYNIGTTETTTIRALADIVLKIGKSKLQPLFAPPRVGDIDMFRPDISRARKYLGYSPTVKIRDGLQKTIDWFVETGRAPRPAGYAR